MSALNQQILDGPNLAMDGCPSWVKFGHMLQENLTPDLHATGCCVSPFEYTKRSLYILQKGLCTYYRKVFVVIVTFIL